MPAPGTPSLPRIGVSNHIRAVAAAGQAAACAPSGAIRGERIKPLNYAASRGMQLTYLDRETYPHKHEPEVVDGLRQRFGE